MGCGGRAGPKARVSPTAQAPHLEHGKLKRLMESASPVAKPRMMKVPAAGRRRARSIAPPAFVELMPSAVTQNRPTDNHASRTLTAAQGLVACVGMSNVLSEELTGWFANVWVKRLPTAMKITTRLATLLRSAGGGMSRRAGLAVDHVRLRIQRPDGFGAVYIFPTLADFLGGTQIHSVKTSAIRMRISR